MLNKRSTFYNGINVCTRQLLDSQGPLIEEFAKHSREYHNLRDDVTRGRSNGDGALKGLTTINAKLDSMDRLTKKINQTIHEIKFGCENCSGLYLTKDCDLDENNNLKA